MSTIHQCVAFVVLFCQAAPATSCEADAPAPKIAAVMEFELIDDTRDYERPEVKEVSSGRMLYVKSVDLRNNTDNSWLRGIRYMVDSIDVKKQHLR